MPDSRIDRLAETPKTVATLVADATDQVLDATSPGDWSARTLLAHLRDGEYLSLRPALERALAEDLPAIHLVHGDSWEPRRNRTRDRREWLLGDFALQRQASVTILRTLRPEDWEREVTRQDAAMTVSGLVDHWLRHDMQHLAQLERLLGETTAEVLVRRSRMIDPRTGRPAGFPRSLNSRLDRP